VNLGAPGCAPEPNLPNLNLGVQVRVQQLAEPNFNVQVQVRIKWPEPEPNRTATSLTATGSLVAIGWVQSGCGRFSGPCNRTFKH
jgi:preprotein translocase subunit SecB